MRTRQRFETVPVRVDAMQFQPPDPPDQPEWPVRLAECGCDAMDGYTCDMHRRPPTYSYRIEGRARWHWIRPGDWYVRFADGDVEVVTEAVFRQRYRPEVA